MIQKVLGAIKTILPRPVHFWISRQKAKMLGVERQYVNLSTAEVFDKIYRDGDWGKDYQGNPTSGSGSHTNSIVTPYVSKVTELLQQMGNPSVVDLGCGDFNVGHQILPHAKHYTACDISQTILNRNKLKFLYDNLEFRHVNLASDELPSGDVAFVRQVLQHLSNDEISKFVAKINSGNLYRYLVITEHLPVAAGFVPNIDKPDGAGIRLPWGSGIDLAEAPFSFKFKDKEVILKVPDDPAKPLGMIVTTVYTL